MSENKRLLKNTGLIAIGNVGAKMISFLLLPLYTSILSTTEYGTYDFIVATCAFLLPIITMSMHEAMFRFIIDTGNKGEEFKKIISNAIVVVISGIIVLGGIMIFLAFFVNTEIALSIWIYVASSSLYVFANNLLRGLGRIKEYAIISSGKNILQLILNIIVVAVLKWGIDGLLFALCISEVIAFFLVAYISRLWNYVNIKYLSKNVLKEMLTYSLPLIPNSLCAQIVHLSDRLVISGYLGPHANGIYAVSHKFPSVVETIYHYFYTAWSESASRVFSRGKEEAEKFYQSLYVMVNNMMFSVILLLISGMPILFRMFIRGEYVEGFNYVPILLLAMYFDSVAKFFSGLYTALKKTRIMAISTFIAAMVNLFINLMLIVKIGLYAAAISTLIANMILVLVRRKFICKDIRLQDDFGAIVREVLVVIVILLLYSYDNWYKIIISMILAVGYTIIINKNVIRSLFWKIKK